MLSPSALLHPNATCQSVFRLPGIPPSRLHYVADGAHAWVAVKFGYLPGSDTMEYYGGQVPGALPDNNYRVSPSLLAAIAKVGSDIVMAEAESFVYAHMASSAAYAAVSSNIQGDCVWFKNTHGVDTLESWMSPLAPGFNIPDAQQNALAGCNGLYSNACGSGGSSYVLDSCGNSEGSKLDLVHLFRMRCPSTSTNCDHSLTSAHSIWFRIPMSNRSVCDDSTGQLNSTSPVRANMLSFTSVTLHGASFSPGAKYTCLFFLPLQNSPTPFILAKYVSPSQLVCYIPADFVASEQYLPIGLEQEICSGGSCFRCPIRTGGSSSQIHSSYYLAFAFLPSLLKPSAAIVVPASGGSKVSVPVVGGSLSGLNFQLVFPITNIILEDAFGFNASSPGTYVPGSWPSGALEFIVPEWPNESDSARLTTSANYGCLTCVAPLYSVENISVTLVPAWNSAFPVELSDASPQISVTGSGFRKLRSYSCVFSPLYDGANPLASNIVVRADYISVKILRCLFSAAAGRYRLNVHENGIALFKSGTSVDVIMMDRVLSIAPSQIFAGAADFSLTLSGTGFDANAQVTSYECIIVAPGNVMVSSKSAVAGVPYVPTSSTPSSNQVVIVCVFSPWGYTAGTFGVQLINRRFNRYVSGSSFKVVVMPVWTAITPSSASNLFSSVITLSGYGLPVSLYVEATFRSVQDGSQFSKALAVMAQSPFRVVLETPIWYYAALIAVVELAVASSSTSIVFSGNSSAFVFAAVLPTLNFSPSVLDCSSQMAVTVYDARRFLTNGTGYQCQLLNNFTEVIVPAVYITETSIQCRFGLWNQVPVPSALQLLYYGSKVAISRSSPLCKQKVISIVPSVMLSGSRYQVTVVGSFIDVGLKYACVLGGSKSATVYPNPLTLAFVCAIDVPQTSPGVTTSMTVVTNDVESDPVPLLIQSSWKSVYPSVVCLNSKSLVTVTGTFFSKLDRHELVYDYQTVLMAEYLKGTYVKPFPVSRSSVVSQATQVIGSTAIVFVVPFTELLNAIEIQVSLRINGVFAPVDASPNLRQISLPFFTSAVFSPEIIKGTIAYYDARDLKTCGTPCRWNPRAGITGALIGSAQLQDGWVMSPVFSSEFNTTLINSNPSTLIIGFKTPVNSVSKSIIVHHGPSPGSARIAMWLQGSVGNPSYLRWTDDPNGGLNIPYGSAGGSPAYWVGSIYNSNLTGAKQSLDTADHSKDWSTAAQVTVNTVDSPLKVGSCFSQHTNNFDCGNFVGGIKFVLLYDRELSSQEHLSIARWANLTHGLPSFRHSDVSFIEPWGMFPSVGQYSLSACAVPLLDLNNASVACQTFPFQGNYSAPIGVACVSAKDASFRLSLAGGFYARSPNSSDSNWLSDPASSFVCEISNLLGFRASAHGTVVSATYSSISGSNFVDNIIIQCNTSSIFFLGSSMVNGTFKYANEIIPCFAF